MADRRSPREDILENSLGGEAPAQGYNRRQLLLLETTGALMFVSGRSRKDNWSDTSISESLEDLGEDTGHEFTVSGGTFSVGDGRTITREFVVRATTEGTNSNFYYGEVSFIMPKRPPKGSIDLVDQFHPLNFIRCMGIPRKDAVQELMDPNLYTRVQVVLREARVWARWLTHEQATLLYAAAEAMVSGRYMMEYMGIVTDAIINHKILNFTELDEFLRLIRHIYLGNISWQDLLPTVQQKPMKSPKVLQYAYTAQKVFHETFQQAQLLKEEDDALLNLLQKDADEPETLATQSTSENVSEPPEDRGPFYGYTRGDRIKDRAQLHDLLNRAPTTLAEMQHYSCIFANLYDFSLYKYIPMIGHMIARGMFTHHTQVEAVIQYLSEVSGIQLVKMSQMKAVIRSTNEWLSGSGDNKSESRKSVRESELGLYEQEMLFKQSVGQIEFDKQRLSLSGD